MKEDFFGSGFFFLLGQEKIVECVISTERREMWE